MPGVGLLIVGRFGCVEFSLWTTRLLLVFTCQRVWPRLSINLHREQCNHEYCIARFGVFFSPSLPLSPPPLPSLFNITTLLQCTHTLSLSTNTYLGWSRPLHIHYITIFVYNSNVTDNSFKSRNSFLY